MQNFSRSHPCHLWASLSISTLSGCPQTPSSYSQVPVNFCLSNIPGSAGWGHALGGNHIHVMAMWSPEWSVKFPIASPCIWSLSVSSNSCLKTLIILNFLQSVWKLLQENWELEKFPEIFSHCFDHQGGSSLWTHWSLRTLQISLFRALLQCRGFFENNEFQRSLFSQLWPRQSPHLPLPMTSSSAPLSFWYTDHGISMLSLFSDAQGVMVWSNSSPSFWNVLGGIFLDF